MRGTRGMWGLALEEKRDACLCRPITKGLLFGGHYIYCPRKGGWNQVCFATISKTQREERGESPNLAQSRKQLTLREGTSYYTFISTSFFIIPQICFFPLFLFFLISTVNSYCKVSNGKFHSKFNKKSKTLQREVSYFSRTIYLKQKYNFSTVLKIIVI